MTRPFTFTLLASSLLFAVAVVFTRPQRPQPIPALTDNDLTRIDEQHSLTRNLDGIWEAQLIGHNAVLLQYDDRSIFVVQVLDLHTPIEQRQQGRDLIDDLLSDMFGLEQALLLLSRLDMQLSAFHPGGPYTQIIPYDGFDITLKHSQEPYIRAYTIRVDRPAP